MITINFKENGQNSLNFYNVRDEDYEFPNFLDYEEVLKHSIKEGFISNENDIVSLCDGCDQYQAYFCTNTAEEACSAELEGYGCEYIEGVTEYDVF